MPIQEAQNLAMDAGLDLVEVFSQGNPPVCAIMDFGKYKFDQKKKIKEQQSKSKSAEPKTVRFRPVSDDHDIETKIKHIKDFLSEKRMVFVTMLFKNRELVNKDHGQKIIEHIITSVSDVGKVESPPRFEGRSLNVRLSPKKD